MTWLTRVPLYRPTHLRFCALAPDSASASATVGKGACKAPRCNWRGKAAVGATFEAFFCFFFGRESAKTAPKSQHPYYLPHYSLYTCKSCAPCARPPRRHLRHASTRPSVFPSNVPSNIPSNIPSRQRRPAQRRAGGAFGTPNGATLIARSLILPLRVLPKQHDCIWLQCRRHPKQPYCQGPAPSERPPSDNQSNVPSKRTNPVKAVGAALQGPTYGPRAAPRSRRCCRWESGCASLDHWSYPSACCYRSSMAASGCSAAPIPSNHAAPGPLHRTFHRTFHRGEKKSVTGAACRPHVRPERSATFTSVLPLAMGWTSAVRTVSRPWVISGTVATCRGFRLEHSIENSIENSADRG